MFHTEFKPWMLMEKPFNHKVGQRFLRTLAKRTPPQHRSFLAGKSVAARPAKSGLTLLEIVLALSIFCGAMAVLSQLAWNGTRATVQARLKTQATIRCQAKLNEVLAGIEAMQSRSGVQFPDDNHWTWSQAVSPSSYPELVQIDVTVSHRGTSLTSNVDLTLRRWARMQSYFAKAAEENKEEADAKANLEPGKTPVPPSTSTSTSQ